MNERTNWKSRSFNVSKISFITAWFYKIATVSKYIEIEMLTRQQHDLKLQQFQKI